MRSMRGSHSNDLLRLKLCHNLMHLRHKISI